MKTRTAAIIAPTFAAVLLYGLWPAPTQDVPHNPAGPTMMQCVYDGTIPDPTTGQCRSQPAQPDNGFAYSTAPKSSAETR